MDSMNGSQEDQQLALIQLFAVCTHSWNPTAMRAWGELQKDELAAAATLGFTEQLWKTWSSMQAGISTHQWLSGLKMSELMAIAREAGVKPERLDDALDELHPKAAIVGLMNQQATRAFAMDFTELNDEQVSAATVLGLGPDRFTRNPTGGAAFVGGGAAPPVAGPGGTAAAATAAAAADEDELVLLEPAVFSEGERPSCPKCGTLAAPIRGAPVQRARFPCCGVEATPYEVTIAEARRLFASGDFDEAESMFDEAAMLGLDEAVPEEERATCYLYRGLSLVEMDEMDEAMECFASSCEIVALGTRRADKAGAEPAPAPEPATAEGGVSQASTSAVASYIHGLLLRSEGRDESKAKALIDAAIQMAASPAIEDIASNVEEVTRSVGTKDYGKKHTYEQAYSRALQLRCFWDYCGAAALATSLMKYDQYSYAADACTTALGQMHVAKEGVMLEIELGMPQLLSHREEQRRHRVTVACHRARAQCMFHMSAWTQALDDFKETARRVSSDSLVMYHIGLCYLKLEQWRESKEALNKAHKLDRGRAVVPAIDLEKHLRAVNQELKKQEQAASKAEQELLASLEAESTKSKKPSKKQKKRQREAEKARVAGKAATQIEAFYRGWQARRLAVTLRQARDEAREQARRHALQQARDEKQEKARVKAELSAEAVAIDKAVALAKSRVKAGDELDDYMCPLTLAMFIDPVRDALGHTYERKAIDHWLSDHTTSPKTNEELPNKVLKPDRIMKAAVETIRALSKTSGGDSGKGSRGNRNKATVEAPKDEYTSEEVERDCPLCCEAFDETDLVFKACPCEYKVCLYCFHHIKDRGDGKCPACRADYGDGEMGAKRPAKPKNSRKSLAARNAAAPSPAPAPAPQEPAPNVDDMMADPTYRTKICKRWQDGHCSYGASCWFAHGKEQLRSFNAGSNKHDSAANRASAHRAAAQQTVQHDATVVPAGNASTNKAASQNDRIQAEQVRGWGAPKPAMEPAPAPMRAVRTKQFPFDVQAACEYCVTFRIEAVDDTSKPINKPNQDGSCGGKYAQQKFHKGKPWKKCIVVRPKNAKNTAWTRTRPRPSNYNGKLCFNEAGNTWSAKKNTQSRLKLQPVLGCANDKQCRFAHGGFEKRLWETPCPFGNRKRCEYGDLCPFNHDVASAICAPCPPEKPAQTAQKAEDKIGSQSTDPNGQTPTKTPWQTQQPAAGMNVGMLSEVIGSDSSSSAQSGIGSLGASIGPLQTSLDQSHGTVGAIGTQRQTAQQFDDLSVQRPGGFFSSGFFGNSDPSQDWLSGSHTRQLNGMDTATGAWPASAGEPTEGSVRSFMDFVQVGIGVGARAQPTSSRQPAETVDYEYTLSSAFSTTVTLRFDGFGRFASVSAGSETAAGVWSIQRRHDSSGTTVVLTLKWSDRLPDALLSGNGGQSFVSQARQGGPRLQLRSHSVPGWFLPSPPQRRPESDRVPSTSSTYSGSTPIRAFDQRRRTEPAAQQRAPTNGRDDMPSPQQSRDDREQADPQLTFAAPTHSQPSREGQQWHAYLGWVDAKLTPKQLHKEEKKQKKEEAKQRKQDGVTQLTGFQPVFNRDLNRLREQAEGQIARMQGADAADEVQQQGEGRRGAAESSPAASPSKAQPSSKASSPLQDTPMRQFLASIDLADRYFHMLERQEFVDVELFSQCTDGDFAELGMDAAHVQRIRKALPMFLKRQFGRKPCTFAPDPRVRQLLEMANVDVEKYLNLFTAAEIDFEAMQLMSASDMKEIGVSALGPRRKILHAISTF